MLCFDFVAVLSDANKRLMYDVGVYDSDDDENVSHEFHTCTSWDPPLLAFFYYPKLIVRQNVYIDNRLFF
jgi:hypothetical protein